MGIKRREGKVGKKMLKQAMKISDEDIARFLDGMSLPELFLDNQFGILTIHSWHPQNGEMELTIDDDALAHAVILYLERHGVPVITNRVELKDLARRNAWTNFPHESD
jgi:hypothetical protein